MATTRTSTSGQSNGPDGSGSSALWRVAGRAGIVAGIVAAVVTVAWFIVDINSNEKEESKEAPSNDAKGDDVSQASATGQGTNASTQAVEVNQQINPGPTDSKESKAEQTNAEKPQPRSMEQNEAVGEPPDPATVPDPLPEEPQQNDTSEVSDPNEQDLEGNPTTLQLPPNGQAPTVINGGPNSTFNITKCPAAKHP